MKMGDDAPTAATGWDRTRIEIGEVLRVPYTREADAGGVLLDFRNLTRGPFATAASTQQGIAELGGRVRGADGLVRSPAVVLFSNPYVHGSRTSPWADVIDADRGYAVYHGDNKRPGRPA